MKKIATLLVFTLVIAAGPVLALDTPIDEGLMKAADHDSFAVKAPGMLLQGVYEVAEAPLETLQQPLEETKKDHTFGFFRGLNKGAYNMLEGMTRGIFNILRAPVPGMKRYEKTTHQNEMLPDLKK